jgi:hypothetical protein
MRVAQGIVFVYMEGSFGSVVGAAPGPAVVAAAAEGGAALPVGLRPELCGVEVRGEGCRLGQPTDTTAAAAEANHALARGVDFNCV